MVKNDWESVGFAWVGYSALALMSGFIFLASLDFPGRWWVLVNTAIFSSGAIFYFIQARRWKPMNYRRQMAAVWGFAAGVPLAQSHPFPNVGALPLPFTITLKPNWPKFLLALGALVGAFLISDVTAYQNYGIHIINTEDPLELAFFLLPVLAVGLICVLLLRAQRIEITAEGLTVRNATGRLHGTQRIRWHDARLFAIRDSKPNTSGTRYELSGPYKIVQWQRLRRPRWWSLYRPAIPFAEYDAQMEALIALITGITGLPLYDVR